MSLGKTVKLQMEDGEIKEFVYFEKCITCNARPEKKIMYFRLPEGVLICNECHHKYPEKPVDNPTKGRWFPYMAGHGIVSQEELKRLAKTGTIEDE